MEFNDVINEKDEVVGSVPHEELYEKKLPHRIVHVLIFDDVGKIVLQKRSAKKSFCPLHWCTAAGGHVQAGETYEEAALRELEEELGVNVPVEFMFKTKYIYSEGSFKSLGIFKAKFGGPFDVNPDEVDAVESFSIRELLDLVEKEELFHPELKFLLKEYYHLL